VSNGLAVEKQNRACWSEGSQIFFLDGKGYGLAPDLHTVSLGNEADIKKLLAENKGTGNEILDAILRIELEQRNNNRKATPTLKRYRMRFQSRRH